MAKVSEEDISDIRKIFVISTGLVVTGSALDFGSSVVYFSHIEGFSEGNLFVSLGFSMWQSFPIALAMYILLCFVLYTLSKRRTGIGSRAIWAPITIAIVPYMAIFHNTLILVIGLNVIEVYSLDAVFLVTAIFGYSALLVKTGLIEFKDVLDVRGQRSK